MSEGGDDPLKNGEVSTESNDRPTTEQTEIQCPEVDFSPYDEHGRPKPNVCICPCPPKLSDPESQVESSQENPSNDTRNGSSTSPSKESTNGPSKDTPNSPSKESPNDTTQDSTENPSKEPTQDEQPKNESQIPEMSAEEQKSLNKAFSEQFKLFSKFGDTKSDGKLLSLSQSDKWMKQAKVIDGKHITTTDTGIHFKKLKSLKVSEADYIKFLEDLAKTKKTTSNELKKKMISCGPPGLSSQVAGAKAPSAFDRLTDTTKYTGSHKQRFDESGKGRGIAGRKDVVDKSGYVSGYMNKNTYDKKNPSK